jgi:transcriptional regulator with XRE-family HTH domain
MPRPFKKPLPPVAHQNSVGVNIAALRKKKGLSQAQLAQLIGITQTLISDYEIGRLHLNDDMIIRFSRALGVSADSILGLVGKEMEQEPPLKITKRLQKIQILPQAKQKTVLQALDLALKAVNAEETT